MKIDKTHKQISFGLDNFLDYNCMVKDKLDQLTAEVKQVAHKLGFDGNSVDKFVDNAEALVAGNTAEDIDESIAVGVVVEGTETLDFPLDRADHLLHYRNDGVFY